MYQSKYPHYQVAGQHRENLAKKRRISENGRAMHQQLWLSQTSQFPAELALGNVEPTIFWIPGWVICWESLGWAGGGCGEGPLTSPLQCTFLRGHHTTSPAATVGTALWATRYVAAGYTSKASICLFRAFGWSFLIRMPSRHLKEYYAVGNWFCFRSVPDGFLRLRRSLLQLSDRAAARHGVSLNPGFM